MATEGILGRSLGPPERQGTIVGGAQEERGGTTIGASFSVHTLRQQDTAYMTSGGRHEMLLLSWAPEAGTGRHHR